MEVPRKTKSVTAIWFSCAIPGFILKNCKSSVTHINTCASMATVVVITVAKMCTHPGYLPWVIYQQRNRWRKHGIFMPWNFKRINYFFLDIMSMCLCVHAHKCAPAHELCCTCGSERTSCGSVIEGVFFFFFFHFA